MGSNKLSESRLRDAAGDVIFGRGEGYVQYVSDLHVVGTRARATIRTKNKNVYLVELDWGTYAVGADCTCRHFAKGFFCKHLVALGLAALADQPSAPPAVDLGLDGIDIQAYLNALDADGLRRLVADLAARESVVDQYVRVRAAMARPAGGEVVTELVRDVSKALTVNGFVDYRRSFVVADRAMRLLDGLESRFDNGAADIIRPALLRALTRLRAITLNADDSAGVIGDACQRAANMYAWACRAGNPETIKLGRWLARFRGESPGWPKLTLDDFIDALDAQGLAVYRREVHLLDRRQVDEDRWKRFEVTRMLLELADHDGDVDRAIAYLAADGHTDFHGIVERLRAAGRDAEALEWTDKAVAAGRISDHFGTGPYWLDPAEVAESYLEVGRREDALAVLRKNFADRPELASYRLLLRFAERMRIGDQERDWALATARELAGADPHSNGGVLIEIALAEGDLEAAWLAADRYGPGNRWRELAAASAATMPRRAADLHLPGLRGLLSRPNAKVYPDVARTLATMKDLYASAGECAAFEQLMATLRADYGRRPALMKAFDQRGL